LVFSPEFVAVWAVEFDPIMIVTWAPVAGVGFVFFLGVRVGAFFLQRSDFGVDFVLLRL